MAMQHKEVVVTPTITASSAYASGNQIGGLMTLNGVNNGQAEGCVLQKIVVVDKAGQSAAVDVLLFNASVSVGADKANVNISNADMASACIGNLKVLAVNYSAVTGATASIATFGASNMPLYCKPAAGQTNTGILYAVLVSRGTPTYGSTSDLTVKFHFTWDA